MTGSLNQQTLIPVPRSLVLKALAAMAEPEEYAERNVWTVKMPCVLAGAPMWIVFVVRMVAVPDEKGGHEIGHSIQVLNPILEE